jgi:hypothetical protein
VQAVSRQLGTSWDETWRQRGHHEGADVTSAQMLHDQIEAVAWDPATHEGPDRVDLEADGRATQSPLGRAISSG